ncbi:hypothetical protein NSP_15160 [Nodularia spumigena CCY9414]|nr:hypothetical protein NSP_15160 [Nodularia spumigena CCY9414]
MLLVLAAFWFEGDGLLIALIIGMTETPKNAVTASAKMILTSQRLRG